MVLSHGHCLPGFHQRGIKSHYNEQHRMFEDTVRFTLYYMCTMFIVYRANSTVLSSTQCCIYCVISMYYYISSKYIRGRIRTIFTKFLDQNENVTLP